MFSRLAGRKAIVGFAVLSTPLAGVVWWKVQHHNHDLAKPFVVLAKSGSKHEDHTTRREKRFNQFASCQLGEQYLMTPADFLESIIHDDIPGWTRKRELTPKEIDQKLRETPPVTKGSSKFFRNLHDKGIITFSEYLFLVTVLTKSKRGIEIAFRMLDVDRSNWLDKNEFMALADMVNRRSSAKSMAVETARHNHGNEQFDTSNTTLLTHFFGPRGTGRFTFDQFSKFMEYLQVEVLEMEFTQYSRGLPTIPEESFARLLLKNTSLCKEDMETYVKRLNSRMKQRQGITLQQFVDFGLFLNNLDDFAMAMRIYSISGSPVTPDEFQRAVKISTGHTVENHVAHVVFLLFDEDGDGKLSYHEFIELMKDRVKRGFKEPLSEKTGWEGFKLCVKKEVAM